MVSGTKRKEIGKGKLIEKIKGKESFASCLEEKKDTIDVEKKTVYFMI